MLNLIFYYYEKVFFAKWSTLVLFFVLSFNSFAQGAPNPRPMNCLGVLGYIAISKSAMNSDGYIYHKIKLPAEKVIGFDAFGCASLMGGALTPNSEATIVVNARRLLLEAEIQKEEFGTVSFLVGELFVEKSSCPSWLGQPYYVIEMHILD